MHLEPQPKLFDRDLEVPLNAGKIISLIGVRRSGKTSLLFSLIGKLNNLSIARNKILYMNFEDERLDFQTKELDLVYEFPSKVDFFASFSELRNPENDKIDPRKNYEVSCSKNQPCTR